MIKDEKAYQSSLRSLGWIGVDLDGTLAHYERWTHPLHIGEPIMPMVQRVRQWLDEGRQVKIFTARIMPLDGTPAEEILVTISDWCFKHIGERLPITNIKDPHMIELWDDRAVQVEPNTGRPIGRSTRGLE